MTRYCIVDSNIQNLGCWYNVITSIYIYLLCAQEHLSKRWTLCDSYLVGMYFLLLVFATCKACLSYSTPKSTVTDNSRLRCVLSLSTVHPHSRRHEVLYLFSDSFQQHWATTALLVLTTEVFKIKGRHCCTLAHELLLMSLFLYQEPCLVSLSL